MYVHGRVELSTARVLDSLSASGHAHFGAADTAGRPPGASCVLQPCQAPEFGEVIRQCTPPTPLPTMADTRHCAASLLSARAARRLAAVDRDGLLTLWDDEPDG